MNLYPSPRIAVLRGGDRYHAQSISSGYGVLDSLQTLPDTEVVDVYIDEEGVWHNKGVVTDPHQVFSNIDGYIDTTHIKNATYQSLAERMGIRKLFSHHKLGIYDDREAIYRLLRQAGVLVPESRHVRVERISSPGYLSEIWKSLHPPYLIRAVSPSQKYPSRLIKSFEDLKEAAKFYEGEQSDFHIVPYRGGQTISVAVLPKYKGSDVYISIPVVSLLEEYEVPNDSTKLVVYRLSGGEEKELREVVTRVHESLSTDQPICVDLIKTKRGLMVVEVKCKPSLREGGRFMESLSATGTELGHFLMTRM